MVLEPGGGELGFSVLLAYRGRHGFTWTILAPTIIKLSDDHKLSTLGVSRH